MTDDERVNLIDTQLSHVWMVRTFLKHCEEAEEDDELREVFRTLYDFMHSLGDKVTDPPAYLKQCRKKQRKLIEATELFLEIQPEISDHTNFKMAARSLRAAVNEVQNLTAGQS